MSRWCFLHCRIQTRLSRSTRSPRQNCKQLPNYQQGLVSELASGSVWGLELTSGLELASGLELRLESALGLGSALVFHLELASVLVSYQSAHPYRLGFRFGSAPDYRCAFRRSAR